MLIEIYCKSRRLDIIFSNFLKKSKYIALSFINSVLFSICTSLSVPKSTLLFSKLSLYPYTSLDLFYELRPYKAGTNDGLFEKLIFMPHITASSVSLIKRTFTCVTL